MIVTIAAPTSWYSVIPHPVQVTRHPREARSFLAALVDRHTGSGAPHSSHTKPTHRPMPTSEIDVCGFEFPAITAP